MSNLDNIDMREGNERIVSKASSGFSDPTGKYPKTDYTNQSSVNKVARGASVNNLNVRNGIAGTPLEYSPVTASYYPLNQVNQSASGHIHETNDTPGSERILTKHNKGGGIDMLPDGTILIATGNGVGNRIEVVGGNYQMTVEGDGTVHYSGNMNMTVTGDYNLDVKGDYIVNVAGDQKVNILGSSRNYIAGIFEQIVQGSFSTTVLGLATNTYLSDFVSNVKGAFINRVEGVGNYFHKGVTKFTSETGSDFSSKNTNIFADNLTVMGDTGKIGNSKMPVFCSNLFATNVFGSQVEASTGVLAPLFQGNLAGRAESAEKAGIAYSTVDGALATTKIGSLTEAVRDTGFGTNLPNSGLVEQILTQSDVGYRKVTIDQDDGIKNSINQSKNTGGVSKTELTTAKLRSKLKNSNNFDNETLISECITRKILNPKYKEATPKNIGRIKNEKRTATTGTKVIGTDVAGAKTKLFLPSDSSSKSKKTSLIPESRFNAANATEYKMATKLTNRSSLAKFIAAPADGTNIKYIANQEGLKPIFRNLFPHAMILDLFYVLDEFEGYSLNVVEGLYVLGPDEIAPPTNSVKDFAKVGRSVAYELTDTSGKIDNEKTYDLAVYLKDNAHYDTLSLYYDTITPNSDVVHSQIVMTTPAMPEDYTAFFNMKVDTYYNFKVLSNTDLIEVPDNV